MRKSKIFMAALLLAGTLFSAASNAQDIKGKTLVNAGIGLGTYGFTGTGGVPITVSAEHGFSDKISAGVFAGLVSKKYYDWKYRYVVAGVRGSYHFNEALGIDNDKIDLYGGVSIFYRGFKVKYAGHDTDDEFEFKASGGTMDFAIHAAGRYYFNEKVGAFAELGYGISPLQLGVTVKL